MAETAPPEWAIAGKNPASRGGSQSGYFAGGLTLRSPGGNALARKEVSRCRKILSKGSDLGIAMP